MASRKLGRDQPGFNSDSVCRHCFFVVYRGGARPARTIRRQILRHSIFRQRASFAGDVVCLRGSGWRYHQLVWGGGRPDDRSRIIQFWPFGYLHNHEFVRLEDGWRIHPYHLHVINAFTDLTTVDDHPRFRPGAITTLEFWYF